MASRRLSAVTRHLSSQAASATIGIQASKPRPYKWAVFFYPEQRSTSLVDRLDIPKAEWDRCIALAKLTNLEPWLDCCTSDWQAKEESTSDYDFSNDFGIKPSRLLALHDRLLNGFDWSAWQDRMNAMGDHRMVTVTGVEGEEALDVHYVVRKSDDARADWVILVHGWPGSFLEFYKMAPLLSQYHVIIPSLPGYGPSAPPKSGPDFTLIKAAQVVDAVGRAAGATKYVVQGGDWGSIVSQQMARLFPERCRGIHVNLSSGKPSGDGEIEQKGLERARVFETRGNAYQHMHYTVPYTVGAMLSSSPIAALAYIGEKMYRWSAPPYPDLDEIIANTMLYYLTGHTTSSLWLYYTFHGQKRGFLRDEIEIPAAFGGGPEDVLWTGEAKFKKAHKDVVFYKFLKRGGHFAALEEPELLADSFKEFMESKQVRASLATA